MVTLYNVISADGFIARTDGNEDFIPDELWPTTLAFFERFDTLVVGARTYEALQSYDQVLLDPFERLPIKKVVVTRDRGFHPKPGYIVAHSPESAVALGEHVLVVSGPTLNTYLLEHKMVDCAVHHQLPVAIQTGIKPFNIEAKGHLIPVSDTPLPNGVRKITYRVLDTNAVYA